MSDRKPVFDAIKAYRNGAPFSQDEVDRIDAFLDQFGLRVAQPIPLPADNGKFPGAIIAGAIQAERTYGVPASVSLAQWALESGYGKSMPPNSNNPFGMKARKGETGPTVMAATREQRADGTWYTINAPFRVFRDMGEAFEEHAKLVGTAKVYAPARAKLPDVDAYVDALGPIYATAKDYAKIIKQIMRANNLYQYNRGGSA